MNRTLWSSGSSLYNKFILHTNELICTSSNHTSSMIGTSYNLTLSMIGTNTFSNLKNLVKHSNVQIYSIDSTMDKTYNVCSCVYYQGSVPS